MKYDPFAVGTLDSKHNLNEVKWWLLIANFIKTISKRVCSVEVNELENLAMYSE